MPIKILIRTTVVPIRGIIGTTVVRIRILTGRTVVRIASAAYNTLVHPQLEYAAPVWDPHFKEKILQLEKVQHRAARWTTSSFDYRSSVTAIVNDLGWRTLEQRRADARRNQDNSPTRQLTDTVFETIHRQILRQLTDTL